MWHYVEQGNGAPLVLLHGIGMSHAVWNRVIPYLAGRRVMAFDIAGFGSTPRLPKETPPTVANLVAGLHHSLRAMGVEVPVDMVGNSLGGCIALEAARQGIARSVVAIAPSGLWSEPPRHARYVFAVLLTAVRKAPGLVRAIMRIPPLRELMLAVPVSFGTRRMSSEDALRSAHDLAIATAFERTFKHTSAPFTGVDISVPVTVAFGDRDCVLPKSSRRSDTLPPHTRWIEKRGWGHVPMCVDPEGVASLILDVMADTALQNEN
jgi:pimeloyl-ACP methyl ester carboxylesterase